MVLRFGFIAWKGPALNCAAGGRLASTGLRHFDEFGKPVFIQNFCDQWGIALSGVCHMGACRSDIELFKQAGLSIGLTASANGRAVASTALEAKSLLGILPLLA